LTAAKDNSAAAALAVRDQVSKEKLWREWLYCELGARITDSTADWWTFSQNDAIANGTAPDSCIVPAVVADDGSTEVRAAVTYYTSKATVTAEPDDGSQRWNATVDLATATTAEEASSERSAVDAGMGDTEDR
jgi:hypothetical protein